MKKIAKFFSVSLASSYLFVSSAAMAQTSKSVDGASGSLSGGGGDIPIGALLANIATFFIYRIVPFLIALGFMVFVWGVVNYFFLSQGSDEGRAKGKSLMVYGISAMVVIVIFWGIVNLVSNSTGLQAKKIETEMPKSVSI